MPLHNICLETQGSRPTTRLLIARLVTYHEEKYITCKSQNTQLDGSSVDNIRKEVVYAIWNIREIAYKEELVEILQKNIKSAVITKIKEK
jgi:hypothetical protein